MNALLLSQPQWRFNHTKNEENKMATITQRVDDLDGRTKVTTEPVKLTLNGRTVHLDLSQKHTEELESLLAPYFEAGTEVKRTGQTTASDADRNAEIRTWAQTSRPDLKVSDRGRLPAHVVQAYEEWEREQNTTTPETVPDAA